MPIYSEVTNILPFAKKEVYMMALYRCKLTLICTYDQALNM